MLSLFRITMIVVRIKFTRLWFRVLRSLSKIVVHFFFQKNAPKKAKLKRALLKIFLAPGQTIGFVRPNKSPPPQRTLLSKPNSEASARLLHFPITSFTPTARLGHQKPHNFKKQGVSSMKMPDITIGNDFLRYLCFNRIVPKQIYVCNASINRFFRIFRLK